MKEIKKSVLGTAFFITNSINKGENVEELDRCFRSIYYTYVEQGSQEDLNFWKNPANLRLGNVSDFNEREFNQFIEQVAGNSNTPKEIKDALKNFENINGIVNLVDKMMELSRQYFGHNKGIYPKKSSLTPVYLTIATLSSIGIIGIASLPIFGESSNYLKAFMGAVSLPLILNLEHDAHATNGKSLWKPVCALITCASAASFLYAPKSSICIGLAGFAVDFYNSGDSRKTYVEWKQCAGKIIGSPFS